MTNNLSRPSLANLAHALRHPELWPEKFRAVGWDHRHPHKNAVGLAFAIWNGPRSYDDSNDNYLFALSDLLKTEQIDMLCTHHEFSLFKKSPDLVAERIEKYLRANPEPPHSDGLAHRITTSPIRA